MMEDIEGYINSQTWEAWADSMKVLWDNTEVVLLISVTLSIGAVIYTWMRYPSTDGSNMNLQKSRSTPDGSDGLIDSNMEQSRGLDDIEEINDLPPLCPLSLTSDDALGPMDLTKEIEKNMSLEEKKKEREAQGQQLAAILKLMKEQEDKFGDTSLEDIQKQMKFYCG